MKTKPILLLFIIPLYIGNLSAQNGSGAAEIQFQTKDDLTISASLQYPKVQTNPVPAVILIHQGGSSRQEWFELSLWDQLLEEGYAILAYDIRQHGKSSKSDDKLSDLFNNPKKAPLDLLAAIEFLEKDKRIDAQRIGIIGASIGANLACVAASSDEYHIKSVVSISAKTGAAQNLSGKKEPISPQNAFYIASKNEQKGLREQWARELYDKTSGERKVEIADGNKHGSFILRESKSLERNIIEWIKKTL